MSRADYEVVSIGLGDGGTVILIEDNDGTVSITNDAENVVKEMLTFADQIKVDRKSMILHYIDTDGRKDELKHDGTKFTGFAPVDP